MKKTWTDLIRQLAREEPPRDIDIRYSLRAQLEAAAQFDVSRLPQSTVAIALENLASLTKQGWMRLSLAIVASVSVCYALIGSKALRDAEEMAYLTLFY